MSLAVWLPLNGDLHNQGLGQVTITSTTTPEYRTAGKIGSALELHTRIVFACPQLALLKTFSICFWARSDSSDQFTANWQDVFGFNDLNTSNSAGTFRCETGYGSTGQYGLHWHDNTTYALMANNGSALSGTCYHTNNKNEWHHCTVVVNETDAKIYFYTDGQLIGTYGHAGGSFNSTGSFYTGENNALEGAINDVRIYDHALSPKEVEEIAKGLVLHYPLNNSANNINWLLPNSETTITRASGNTFVDYNYYPDLITNAETSYIVDFYAKGSVDAMKMDVYFRNSRSSYALTPQQTLTTAWEHYSLSLSGSPSSLQLFRARCYGGTAGDFISIRNMRLLSNNMPIRTSIIYDSSGYSHNGTIVGSLTAAVGSPRYDVATMFPTASDYFYFPHLVDSTAMNNEFTFSCWLYRDYTDATARYFYYGLCAIYLSSSFKPCISWIHASEDLSYNQNNAYAPSAAPVIPLQTWTHLVWVFQNGVLYCYINGQQAARDNRSTNGTYIRGTKGSPNASIGYTWIGKISDVRTYATALTAEQVKELYNTSMSIDSNGNVYARELVEL